MSSNLLPLWRAARVITIPGWQWNFEPGQCGQCGAYVLELLCCELCHTPWLCDDCAEQHDCQ